MLRQRPPKPYKLLIFFMIYVISLKKRASIGDFHLTFLQMVGEWWVFTVVTLMVKHSKSLHCFGDAVSTLDTFLWTWNHVSRSITRSLFTLKASNLVKWQLSTWSFMWWCQIINSLNFKLAPVPRAILEWPIYSNQYQSSCNNICHNKYRDICASRYIIAALNHYMETQSNITSFQC